MNRSGVQFPQVAPSTSPNASNECRPHPSLLPDLILSRHLGFYRWRSCPVCVERQARGCAVVSSGLQSWRASRAIAAAVPAPGRVRLGPRSRQFVGSCAGLSTEVLWAARPAVPAACWPATSIHVPVGEQGSGRSRLRHKCGERLDSERGQRHGMRRAVALPGVLPGMRWWSTSVPENVTIGGSASRSTSPRSPMLSTAPRCTTVPSPHG
jgi:hypothetical protein